MSDRKHGLRSRVRWGLGALALAVIAAGLAGTGIAQSKDKGWLSGQGRWVAGDFHHHTTYTDGSNPIDTVNYWADRYGLDWWANSEHGGGFTTDGFGPILVEGFNTREYAQYWDDPAIYPAGTIIGSSQLSGGHQAMWRWQSLRDFEFADTVKARRAYRRKTIIQAFEWNVPGPHEHCSTGLIAGQFGRNGNCSPLAQFEYMFDNSDADTTGGLAQGWAKSDLSGHAKALEAAEWLQKHYPYESWLVPAHPERRGQWDITAFRDLNNAAPSVAFGFESVPGHQAESSRGSYGGTSVGGGTYGGAGVFSAKIGGLWDALLGEGRHWWLFASSDFHNTVADFFPGQYQKTYTFVAGAHPVGPLAARDIVDGLRAGNSFVVMGDLINALEFEAKHRFSSVTMGQILRVERGGGITLKIRFKSPEVNANGDPVRVHHVDLIQGEVTGLIPPGSPAYAKDTNETTRVLATFHTIGKACDHQGWYTFVHQVKGLDRNVYFRLRGTNLASGTEGETDADGNPLLDTPGSNSAAAAWADLWFYSNPIFVKVK
jgi:hypothetical protein